LEQLVLAEMAKRGPLPNLSTFAFTATPKPKTLELFGTRSPDGQFEPFTLYSMRQVIEEEFILDVLEHYTTYKTYWKLLKTIEDDPHY
jgi:type I restriction enzyme R subunit